MKQQALGRRAMAAAGVLAVGVAVGAAAGMPGATVAAQQAHVGEYLQADVNFGMQVYGANCVGCHGPDGDVVDGVNLRSGQFRNAASDRDLIGVIAGGIPGTAMPAGDYNASELTGLVAYLRTMGDFDPTGSTSGDAARGEAIYRGEGDCARCHRIGGEGSRVAPNLTTIATTRTAGSLSATLMNPTEAMLPINRPVRIVTNDGMRYNGRRLNEDTYTVQIIDENERLRSLNKDELREYTILDESPMPSYAETLTDQERADVLAFLLSLRGINR